MNNPQHPDHYTSLSNWIFKNRAFRLGISLHQAHFPTIDSLIEASLTGVDLVLKGYPLAPKLMVMEKGFACQ